VGVSIPADKLAVLLIVCILLAVLVLFIQKSKFGQAMLAIAHDADAASLMGVNIHRISGLVCATGCALAGLAGGLVGSVLVLDVAIANLMLVKIIAVVILAGIGSIGGIWAGGLLLGAVDALGPYFLPNVIYDPFALALVVLILVIRPQGFFGREM